MIEEIREYLYSYENILFALIFGSYAEGKSNELSDLDIGIFTKDEFDLLSFGRIIANLEKITFKTIDLVELNNLYKKSPNFAYQIATNHRIIFVRDNEEYINFKKNAFLYYFDTQYLRDMMNSALIKRIEEFRFGARNYAG